jgi:hypothetical protein
MKVRILYVLLFSCAIFSCKEDNMKYLPGTWRAIKVQNHDIDSTIANGQLFIDTMGKGHDDAANMRIYGFANIDSARKIMQQLHDEAVAAQDSANNSTVFTFRKDGIAVIVFGGRTDSSKWTLDNANNLIVEDYQVSPGEVLKWKIAELTKSELKLIFKVVGDSTIVTFKRDEK